MRQVILLSFLLLFGCNNQKANPNTLYVKVGEIKSHTPSGLKIGVETRNMAAVIALFRWLFTSENAEEKAGDAYKFAQELGLDEVLVCVATFPDGTSKDITINSRNQSFYFKSANRIFKVNITDVDKNGSDVLVTFEVTESADSTVIVENDTKPSVPVETQETTVNPTETTSDTDESKYENEKSYLSTEDTFNDDKTGLHLYVRQVDKDNQVVIGDYRSPDQSETVASMELKVAQPYSFTFESKTYEFTITEIDGKYCTVTVKEQ
jgi:hypothetical protein